MFRMSRAGAPAVVTWWRTGGARTASAVEHPMAFGGEHHAAARCSAPRRDLMIEPVYDDEQAGEIGYVSTPMHAPNPVKSNPHSWQPFFLPVYPVGSTVGPLKCEHMPTDNCPTHGDLIAGAAQAIMPSVYGAGVLGHDHLMDFQGGSDLNPNWELILELLTRPSAAT